MKSNNKSTSKVKLYGLIRKKDSTILILEKNEKFKEFLSEFLSESYCDLCLGLDKPVKNTTDSISSDLGHDYKGLDGQVVYGKNKVFLFLNRSKGMSKRLQNLEKFVRWINVSKHEIKSKHRS